MARLEFNLWDADRLELSGNELVIEGPSLQIHIKLPSEFDLPKLEERVAVKKELEEVIQPIYKCTHAAIAHAIGGGCKAVIRLISGDSIEYAPCPCTKSRSDVSCETGE